MDSLDKINLKTKRAFNLAAQRYHDLFHNELKEKEYDRNLLDSYAGRFKKDALICDVGCGPSGHIGRYVFDKGLRVIGVDISDKCIEMARCYNPKMNFVCGDIRNSKFKKNMFDGIIAFYSILDTPKKYVDSLFKEFQRILKPNGYLLVAVKAGITEGFIKELLGIKADIYFSLFTEEEIANYYEHAGFILELIEKRNPYDTEINNERIYAIGKKA